MQEITQEIWADKYRYGNEASIASTRNRVIDGVYALDPNIEAREEARDLIHKGVIVPAGRIHAGAGTPKRVTLINCFVSPLIQDSMDTIPGEPGKGIMDSLKDAALTQQMGGGIGMDFSTVRPNGALVKRTGSVSSGVLPFMDMWSAMCGTVMSSGSRRGAMMGTLDISHPDIIDFITAKQTKGRLKNFNVSVLVSDSFMYALQHDALWALEFTVPRADGEHVFVYEHNGETRYVYQRIKARELWDKIIENTYIHAEPGVIFMDRVNAMNNLYYCEKIHCTNPCGEQPLPPNGDCNLGHVNLAEMVIDPFGEKPRFNWDLLIQASQVMVRLLDNVLDVALFPTEDQRQEALNKRRVGLGYTGLANALQMLKIRYGSKEAVDLTRQIGKTMADAAYIASLKLAIERGPFPLYDEEKYLAAPFIQKLTPVVKDGIKKHGIRNAVLLSIAPTGTTSILLGNVSSGIEPVFSHEYERKVLQPDGVSFETHTVYDYGYLKYLESDKNTALLPDYFVTAKDLTVKQHLEMQAAAQEWVDASISKTINCPTEMTFEEFKDVYTEAYSLGLKGCTTYRYDPRSARGEVLSEKKADSAPAENPVATETKDMPVAHPKAPMQDVLEGRRYRIKWPTDDNAYYLNINDYVDSNGVRRPFECFISTKSVHHQPWTSALTRTISAIFRREDNVAFLAEELQQVHALSGGMFYQQKYIPSLVAMIGMKIEEHLKWLGLVNGDAEKPVQLQSGATFENHGEICENCHAPAVIKESGCGVCKSCGHSHCG